MSLINVSIFLKPTKYENPAVPAHPAQNSVIAMVPSMNKCAAVNFIPYLT
jgi:hypothetical protein